jgi:hypothetical protein
MIIWAALGVNRWKYYANGGKNCSRAKIARGWDTTSIPAEPAAVILGFFGGKKKFNPEKSYYETLWKMYQRSLKRGASGRIYDLGLQLLSPAEESDSWHQ